MQRNISKLFCFRGRKPVAIQTEICPWCEGEIKVSVGKRPCPKCRQMIKVSLDSEDTLVKLGVKVVQEIGLGGMLNMLLGRKK